MLKRPTPETFLERVHHEDLRVKKGKLKIFLGAVPGVGKTYTMLEEALKKRSEGIDVVVGIVETHGRKETEALLKPLEILPRAVLSYRSKDLEEFDLDQALHRNPFLILVDEMAHTNVPGSRHLKRWQDIEELLDQGIHVYTTLNVQHIESLNDIIAQITHVKVQETIPDSIIERADKIELVDLPPDDLLDRLREGKIYVAHQAQQAAENFFRKENLIALRELVLRVTADLVDAEVTFCRKDQDVKTIWPTHERLLVCVGAEGGSIKLIRSTKRLATHLKADWSAIWIEPPHLEESSEERGHALKALRLAESLGAETHILSEPDFVKAIIEFAREQNITKIIIGKHIRPKWKSFFLKSLTDELIRHSQEIDIYVITQMPFSPKTSVSSTPHPFKQHGLSYMTSLGIVGFCTLLNFLFSHLLFKDRFDSGNVVMVFLGGVIVIASWGTWGPSIFASVLSILSFDFFFVPPRFTFVIEDIQHSLTLLIMIWIAHTISHLSVLTKKQAELARSQEKRTAALYNLSKQLANTRGIENILSVTLRYLEKIFDVYALPLLPDTRGHLKVFSSFQNTLTEKEQSIAQWTYDLGQKAGMGTETLSETAALYLPLKGAEATLGVLRIQSKGPPSKSFLFMPDQMHLLETLAHQMALSLEVEWLQEDKS